MKQERKGRPSKHATKRPAGADRPREHSGRSDIQNLRWPEHLKHLKRRGGIFFKSVSRSAVHLLPCEVVSAYSHRRVDFENECLPIAQHVSLIAFVRMHALSTFECHPIAQHSCTHYVRARHMRCYTLSVINKNTHTHTRDRKSTV